MANNLPDLNGLFKQRYGGKTKADFTVEDWALHNDVTAEDLKKYPLAKIGISKLGQLLTEGEKHDRTKHSALLDLIPEGVKLIKMNRFNASAYDIPVKLEPEHGVTFNEKKEK